MSISEKGRYGGVSIRVLPSQIVTVPLSVTVASQRPQGLKATPRHGEGSSDVDTSSVQTSCLVVMSQILTSLPGPALLNPLAADASRVPSGLKATLQTQ